MAISFIHDYIFYMPKALFSDFLIFQLTHAEIKVDSSWKLALGCIYTTLHILTQ